MPVRGTVMFPGIVMPMDVGRPASQKLLDDWLPTSKTIGLVAQHDPDNETPGPDDIYQIGTAVVVLKLVRQPDGLVTVLVHGFTRFAVENITQVQPYMMADVRRLEDHILPGRPLDAAFKNLRETAIQLIEHTPNVPDQAPAVIGAIDAPGPLADFLAANLQIDIQDKQDILEELDVAKRVRSVQRHVSQQLDLAKLQQKINEDVQSNITDLQRKAYLREQLRAIQKELGEDTGADDQIEKLREQLAEADPPEAIMAEADRELQRLSVIPPASPEYSVIVSYVETIAELPWTKFSEDNLDLDRAQKILDSDHYDLEKVKRRLIEYLAVRKLNPDGRGPILCLLGPPGVGKTSLGHSIADALGRQFSRMSLGGIRDEAEIRGHRRTYIGSMPGRIIQELRRVGTRNPVMMLDEVDKLGMDFHGDPSSALLEVLDPRQNNAFVDRYLDVPFDLSQIMFIATGNYIENVPPPLRDRMEIIEIPGYTDAQKMQIARRYLLPRQITENGLTRAQCRWHAPALRKVIESYTREAGVRELERQIGAVCRAIAARVASGKIKKQTVNADLVAKTLGPEQYIRELKLRRAEPGVVTGLAYTPVGGEVLHVEATKYPGKGAIQLTGHIGDVMRESAQAALSVVKTNADELGIKSNTFSEIDMHIHVPAGAVPKDGPSAGVAMFTAIASLLTNKKVRPDVAMTGEITLRGAVLPIGGIKEKALAAARAGIKTIILPKLNEKDLPDIPEEIQKKLKFIFIDQADQALAAAVRSPRRR
ncbi:MAG: endopeptidase La [Planctomycetaceae bacterium]|nr:endopeptidase La [Planctomycetaceae bacterium]